MSAKRGPYRKCYLVPHGRGFKYLRAIPKDLQAAEQKQAWVKYLGPVSRAEAETLAHALAHEHGKRILTLRGSWSVQPGLFERSDSSEHAAEPTVAATATSGGAPAPLRLGLMDLVLLWEKVRRPRSEISRAKARLCARRFVELVGNLSIDAIERTHAVSYRDRLEGSMKSKNVADHLGRLHVLFTVAMSEGLLESNPFNNVRPRHTLTFASRRQGFTGDHVRDIFEALKGEPGHFAWIVRLLAFHGLRSGEACQLRCDDVTVLHGVPVLRIHDLHGSVKNRASVRDIPIHPICMDIRHHAEAAASEEGGWLFPSLPVKRLGRGRWFQDYGSRFLRHTVGIEDSRYTMHSFRHLWRTLARECEMPESVSRSIMGHTLGAGEHGAYGGAPSLRLRADWIAKIDPCVG